MNTREKKMQHVKTVLFFILILVECSFCAEKKTTENTTEINFAAELLRTAEKYGVNFTINDLDVAESAVDDQEITEVFPLPVAEKLIAHRKRNELDTVREQMIGMIFTGKPIPLGSFITPTRRAFRVRPKKRPFQTHFESQDNYPKEILKPVAFIPVASSVKLPSPRMPSSSLPRFQLPKRSRNGRPRRPMSNSFRIHPPPRYHDATSHFYSGNKHLQGKEDQYDDGSYFSNTVGSDFGPVTYETFGSSVQEPDHYEPYQVHSNGEPHYHGMNILQPFKPSEEIPTSGYTRTKFEFNKKPIDIGPISLGPSLSNVPSLPHTPSLSHGPAVENNIGSTFGLGFSQGGDCPQYTEEICLDTDNYPHEAILSSLVHNPDRVDNMMAEVKEQSADNLVDGLSAIQESKYDYTHYFGNRRQDSQKQIKRDFATDGGYLCPSEVKYARPKKAKNSKGDWKFIVNMDKYTQTIRMEKCMKPGGTCSYISHHYYATCNQIYNYQRLLSWEKQKGLHMDIYKVPSCCSCHIQGYAYIFPPLNVEKDGDFASSRNVENVVKPPIRKIEKTHKDELLLRSINKSTREPNKTNKRRPGGRMPTRRRPGGTNSREKPRRRFDQHSPINRKGDPKRINYGYHPIIDFFNQ